MEPTYPLAFYVLLFIQVIVHMYVKSVAKGLFKKCIFEITNSSILENDPICVSNVENRFSRPQT